MSHDDSSAPRRIMSQLGEPRTVPLLNVTEGDVGVLVGLPVAGLLVAGVLNLDVLVVPLVCTGLALGVATVYAAPPHLTAWDWTRNLLRYYLLRPRVTHSHPPESDHAPTEGGFVEHTPYTPTERTQDLTNVARAWPGVGAVERTDGTFEAFLEVHPDTMDFAMSGDWASVQQTAAEFANTELDFPLTVHATTRSFPVADVVAQLDARLDDSAADDADQFRALIEEYRDRRPADLRDTQQLHYYLGVEVDRLDVVSEYDHEPTPGERLTELPVLGVLFTPFVTRRDDERREELRERMLARLDARVQTVRSEFVEAVPGWSATRLSTLELFVLGTEFWNGEELDADAGERLLRESPAVGPVEGEA